jgi:hypothetical protein
VEKDLSFDPEVLKAGPNTILEGYWQSPCYFKDAEAAVRNSFTFKNESSVEVDSWLKQVAASESVSIHIRRGDYVNNPDTNKIHGTCSLDYYAAAAEKIRQLKQASSFFVFSDDIEWCRANLNIGSDLRFVQHNGTAVDDLRIMSSCRSHIIANSTFSWWGAWLNSNPLKIVIAPAKWFNEPGRNASDLIPESWIRI